MKSLPLVVALLSFLVTSCCGDDTGCRFNDSAAQDSIIGGGTTVDPNASSAFTAAQTAFKNNCIQCHAAFGAYTEAQWISAGYVVAGQPTQSVIFQKTRGSGTGGTENMPPGSTMSSNEIASIRNWITKLGSGGGVTPPASGAEQRLNAALAVFARPSTATGKSCNTCHNGVTTSTFYSGQPVPAFSAFTREAEFVTSQLVTPGLPANSWIYRSLRGHGGDIASMPKNDSTSISSEDAATLNAWITQIGN